MFQTIVDCIEDGIHIINRDHEIISANKGILNMFGKRDLSEVLGRKCFSEYHRLEAACDNCPSVKTFKEGTSNYLSKAIRGVDGKKLFLKKITFPVKDADGNVAQVIEHIKDITYLSELEERLSYSERLAGIGKLAAGVAHEIRNPLSNIKAAVQLCLSKYEPDEMIGKHLKIILRSTNRVNRVINDLINLARPHEVSFITGDINNIINRAFDFVKERCLKQHVRVTKRFQRKLPQFYLDEKLLEESFLNIIINALDAMPKGGRLIITTYYDYDADEIKVSFFDSGYGISEDDLGKVFDPFFTTKRDGTGLGLSLAAQTIELHKGKIHIHSKPDYGTEVTIRFNSI